MSGRAVDSRNYIVAFELQSAADCPDDFHVPPAAAAFDAGIFLPRDDPDWFGRSAYPPRILLLASGVLWAIPHPSAKETPGLRGIENISAVESGHMLLKGWLRFSGTGFHYHVPYNTRGQAPVSRFMRHFQAAWLRSGNLRPGDIAVGADLDVRFGNALADELGPDETPAATFFQAPRETKRGWPLRRAEYVPGDFLVLTSKRVMWITDRDRGTRAQFGNIITYAPLRSLRGMRVAADGNKWHLHLDVTGAPWRIPIQDRYRSEAEAFAERALAHEGPAGESLAGRSSESARGMTRYGADIARSR